MVHQNSAKSSKSARPRRRGTRRSNTNRALGPDIAPSRSTPVRGQTVTIVGEDRLSTLTIASGSAAYSNVMINPGASARLKTLCRAFQRIKWLSVTAVVTPQASTSVSGGYVAGFINDPEDSLVTAPQLSASQGSVTKKFYESAVVRMPPKSDKLYTSIGEDPRLSTPTVFWFITEGPPTSDVTVIVTLNWKIQLSEPVVESVVDGSFELQGTLVSKQSNYNLVFKPRNSTAQIEDFSSYIPSSIRNLEGMHFFRVPTFVIENYEGTGDTGTNQMHFVVYRTADKKLYYSENGSTINQTVWQSNVAVQVVVPIGTYMKYVGQGNDYRQSTLAHQSFKSMAGVDSPARALQEWQTFSQRFQQVEDFLSKLKISLAQNSPTSPTVSTPVHLSQEQLSLLENSQL